MKRIFIPLFSVILFSLLLCLPTAAEVTEADFTYMRNVDGNSVTVTRQRSLIVDICEKKEFYFVTFC